MPASISSLMTVTVVIVDSNAIVSAHLPDPSSFQGLAVTSGVCSTSTWMSANGMAGDTLTSGNRLLLFYSFQPRRANI